ncbi:MAG TPA: hypothetical protein PK208_09890 [Fibrobacteria bacterium]|nr:hypothetical protein [Fibrobacteria bacterium]
MRNIHTTNKGIAALRRSPIAANRLVVCMAGFRPAPAAAAPAAAAAAATST